MENYSESDRRESASVVKRTAAAISLLRVDMDSEANAVNFDMQMRNN